VELPTGVLLNEGAVLTALKLPLLRAAILLPAGFGEACAGLSFSFLFLIR
jgi:hypothetical protein